MNDIPVIQGKNAFIAGVDWKMLPPGMKNARGFARNKKVDKFISCQYRESDNDPRHKIIVALLHQKKLNLPKSVSTCWSLALIITPLLESGGYAIFSLKENIFGFVSCVRGTLVNDVVGTRAEVQEALDTFLQFNTTPDTGWTRYAPEDWAFDDCRPLPLDTLLGARRYPEAARFRDVSRTAVYTGSLLTLIVLAMAWYGWTLYLQHQEEMAAEAERQAMLSMKLAADNASQVMPWHGQPEIAEFLSVCVGHWQKMPISIAGWKFHMAECSSEGHEGSLRYAYNMLNGVTVEDFRIRVNELFGGQRSAYFSLPDGSSGGVTENVSFQTHEAGGIDSLPAGSELQERLTTFAQKWRVRLNYDLKDNSTVDDEGQVMTPPWSEYGLEMQTDIPPSVLFQGFSEPFVRFNAVSAQLNSGRLTYEIKGTFYVKNH